MLTSPRAAIAGRDETNASEPRRKYKPLDPTVERLAYTLKVFGERHALSSTTIYKLAKLGLLQIDHVLGRAVITAESERAYLERLRNGELRGEAKPAGGKRQRRQPDAA